MPLEFIFRLNKNRINHICQKAKMNNKITRRMRNVIHFITLRGASLLIIVQRVACFFLPKIANILDV